MSKRVAIVQSNYIPWKGYFDMIAAVDEFVLYDDAQYTRRDWRNRNRIKTEAGLAWLSVPVQVKGKYDQRICDTLIAEAGWAEKHMRTIRHAYAKAPFFDSLIGELERVYVQCGSLEHLSAINRVLIEWVNEQLGVTATIRSSSEFDLGEGRTEKLLAICKQSGASEYLSGPAAKDYLDENLFNDAGISVAWMDYSGYPEYPQLHGDFEHGVSVVDLLLNCGPDARRYMLN